MANKDTVAKSKKWSRRLLRILWVGTISLAALFVVARVMRRFSGSNQWELYGEKNGVKVYTLKEPGSDLRQVKGVARLHTTLARLVKMMQDPDICADIGCKESHTLERVGDRLQYNYFQMDLPPFQTRDFVVKTQYHQDPRTKAVFLEVSAASDKIPPNPCCLRVTDMNNTLRFTPAGNGEIEIEYVLKENEGGFVPDLYLNILGPQIMYEGLPEMQAYVDRDKYKDAKFDFIE